MVRPTRVAGLGRVPERVLIAPQDIRTGDATIAADIYSGLFAFAGRIVRASGQSPFTVMAPTWAWSAELQGFGWLRHLRVADNAVSRANARALLGEWMDRVQAHRGEMIDDPAVTARRLISLLVQSPLLLNGAEAAFYKRFMKRLALDVKAVSHGHSLSVGYARLLCAIALTYYVICTQQTEAASERVTGIISAELEAQVLPDGGHIARNPGVPVELLLDLLPLRQGFVARRANPPPALLRAIDRIMPMVRMMRHGDGTLALFNGMGVTAPDLVAIVLAYDDSRAGLMENAPQTGYQRLVGENAVVIMDTGVPPKGPLSGEAHAGTLAFEFSHGIQRIVINCGAPFSGRPGQRQAARATAAHSTLRIEDTSSSRFLETADPNALGRNPLVSGPRHVSVERRALPEGVLLATAHDGYVSAFGYRHERLMLLEKTGNRLAGVDRLVARSGRRKPDCAYTVAFHLHPNVRPVAGPKPGEIQLHVNGRAAWSFSVEGPHPRIEESVLFATLEGAKATEQIVIAAQTGETTEIRWSFERLGPL